MDPLGPIMWLAAQAVDLLRGRQRVQALVHRAYFRNPSDLREHFFMKVINNSSDDVEVTHTWFATQPVKHLLNPYRPLLARLRPRETYETWIAVDDLPRALDVEHLGRVQLSTGRIIRSRPNKNVPPEGFVAGTGSK